MNIEKFNGWEFPVFKIVVGLMACTYLTYIYFTYYYSSSGETLLGIILSVNIPLFYVMFCFGVKELKDRYKEYKDFMKEMNYLDERRKVE